MNEHPLRAASIDSREPKESRTLGADRFGVPAAMFGALDPELPALIGRIVMVAALLENKVEALADLALDKPSGHHGRRPISQNLDAIITHLASLTQTDDDSIAFTARVTHAVSEARAALEWRNAVVHRVWSGAGMTGWAGHRSVPSVDQKPLGAAEWQEFDKVDLSSHLSDLSNAVHSIMGCFSPAPRFRKNL